MSDVSPPPPPPPPPPETVQITVEAYAASIGGTGLGAIIGGITWSRRSDHRRRLQQHAMRQQGPT